MGALHIAFAIPWAGRYLGATLMGAWFCEAPMEKIIDKIRKLLALAGNNDSGAEREAALNKAHQLLLQHNLDMSQVADKVEEVSAFNNAMGFNPSPWIRTIVNSIAELYFCKFVWTRTGPKSFKATFVGMRVDAEIAQMVSESLVKSVMREAHAHNRITGGSVASFKSGAAAKIYYRCRKLIDEAAIDSQPGTALVVQSLYKTRAQEADDWMKAHMGELKKPRSRLILRGDEAGQAGARFGETVSLTAQVKKG
jgi:hypothetical protein